MIVIRRKLQIPIPDGMLTGFRRFPAMKAVVVTDVAGDPKYQVFPERDAAVLRSVDLTLMGSGFGSVLLAQVEQAWNSPKMRKRIVFSI
jgi:hypothetical protein